MKDIILACSNCYNRIPQTGWLINNKLFSNNLEVENSMIKVSSDSLSGKDTSWFKDDHIAASLHGRVGEGALWGLFFKGAKSPQEGFTFRTWSSLKVPTSKYHDPGAQKHSVYMRQKSWILINKWESIAAEIFLFLFVQYSVMKSPGGRKLNKATGIRKAR